MAFISRLRIVSINSSLLVLGLLAGHAPLSAQGVFQGDTTGTTFYDGSVAAGVGIPKTTKVSDYLTFNAALSVAQQASKLTAMLASNSLLSNSFSGSSQLGRVPAACFSDPD
jgi:hypothetical protein